MNYEAYLGFGAFNTRKETGEGTIDFVKYRQLMTKGATVEELFEAFPKPKEEK